ncbi:NADH dehydrogenase [ubiquinone] 1 alpha subcomplex subunit 12 isoform X2 [Pseudophryne corroboree]|uniref:NADH dehydrogenase [ubiquinone] 1 alpha subcomplex subunit 12 isoform X2 n=1 Tax=Pseudophryne corroboree TaxID=495146 RepID=UPI0030815D0A
MAEYAQLVRRALQQVRAHGGLWGSFWQILRVSDLKTGTLVGVDKYGNKYYEDKRNFFGRHRWVEYTSEMNGKPTYWDVDGSMVPPECAFYVSILGLVVMVITRGPNRHMSMTSVFSAAKGRVCSPAPMPAFTW